MKKLTLSMEDLRVDTFATGERTAASGTVQGHYGTPHTRPGQPTCDYTCDVTCEATHDYTCEGFATVGGGGSNCVLC